MIVAQRIARTIRTLRAKEKNIFEREVGCVGCTLIKIKVKFAASPDGEEL